MIPILEQLSEKGESLKTPARNSFFYSQQTIFFNLSSRNRLMQTCALLWLDQLSYQRCVFYPLMIQLNIPAGKVTSKPNVKTHTH